MKIILGIITALAFFIGVMVNKMALSIGEQIYAALYYIMALIAFCTLSVLFDGNSPAAATGFAANAACPKKTLKTKTTKTPPKKN